MSLPAKIPFAKQHPSKVMTTKGTYAKGWPLGLTLHFTAGHFEKPSSVYDVMARSPYCFLAVGYDGELVQAHDVRRWGYHAGESALKIAAKKIALVGAVSDDMVGLEVCSAGRLTEYKGEFYPYWAFDSKKNYDGKTKPLPAAMRRTIPKNFENQLAGTYMKYSDAQESMIIRTCFWLKLQAEDIFDFELVRGHDEVAGPLGIGYWRKNDPGGALCCTMEQLRTYLKLFYADFKLGKSYGVDYPTLFAWVHGFTDSPPKAPGELPKPIPPSDYFDRLQSNAAKAGCSKLGAKLVAKLREKKPTSRARYHSIFDVSKSAFIKRLHVIDMKTDTVVSYMCGIGSGSDPKSTGMLQKFSNVSGSNCTSEGVFIYSETYTGKHGLSCKMDGLESTNSNMRKRYIVLHGANYITPSRAGRTNGCEGVEERFSTDLVTKLCNGSFGIIGKES